jgi:cytochrome oxidase Cu insertion factor (SCO1/SenC/PrrC family)
MFGCALLTLLSLPLLGIWLYQWWQGGQGVALQRAPVVDVDWTDSSGQPHSLRAWDDGITLLFLGYLTCADYCPLRLQQLRELAAQWPQDTRQPLRVLFITLDPAHDTAALRRAMIDDPARQIFSGALTPAALQQLQYLLRENVAVRGAAIRHAGNFYLLDGERRLRRVYPGAAGLTAAALAADIRQLQQLPTTPAVPAGFNQH